jgi:hypothetical protein
MKALHSMLVVVIALILIASGVNAYSGYNQRYYTDNYTPSVYYPTPAYAAAYSYPTYYTTSYYYAPVVYPTYVYTYPTVVYPTYVAPATYSGVSVYSSDSGWGISISRGSVCGYYGYC